VIFPENDAANEESLLSEKEMIELFQVIAHKMPSVRSITISGGSYFSQPQQTTSFLGGKYLARETNVDPPLKAITSLLRGKAGGQLLALCFVQIRLLGSERDFQDLLNAIRKHPTLHSFDCSGCVFEKQVHLESLRDACQQKRMLHFMFDGGVVLTPEEDKEEKTEDPEQDYEEQDYGEEATLDHTIDNWGSTLSYHNMCFCVDIS